MVYIDGYVEDNENTFTFSNTSEPLFLAWAPEMPLSDAGLKCLKLNPYLGMENINCDSENFALCENESMFKVFQFFSLTTESGPCPMGGRLLT